MNKPKLIYFDSSASRGEECRLALCIAGVEFDDVRITHADWPSMKGQMPYGALPVLELPGHAPLAQTNAILSLIGRRHGLHPTDDFEAARHESMMQHVEDLRTVLSPTMRMAANEKQAAREALASGFLPAWAAATERNILATPFFAGANISVVDIKLYEIARWLGSGILDHIPATIFADYPKLAGIQEAVRNHAAVKAWYAAR